MLLHLVELMAMGDCEHEALRILTSPGRYIDGNIVVFGGFGAPVPDPSTECESTQVRATEVCKCVRTMEDGCLKFFFQCAIGFVTHLHEYRKLRWTISSS